MIAEHHFFADWSPQTVIDMMDPAEVTKEREVLDDHFICLLFADHLRWRSPALLEYTG